MQERYQGRPLYIFLENLVLHSIGHLDQEKYERLKTVEGKLKQIYNREGDWITILKAELELPEDFELRVRDLWANNAALARKQGVQLSPVDFAQAFVDANFGG